MPGCAGAGMIRRAESTDALEIARLAAELGYPVSASQVNERLDCLLTDSRHCVLVADAADGRLPGWMHVEHRISVVGGERAELMGLIVDPAARRQGIARKLVVEAENWALAKGLSELVVRSNVTRGSSHPFYERMGYVRCKTQHVYRKPVKPA